MEREVEFKNEEDAEAYTCSHCSAVLYEGDISSHGCFSQNIEDDFKIEEEKEQEAEVEYLESEGSYHSEYLEEEEDDTQLPLTEAWVDDWPDSEIRRLLAICIKYLHFEPNTKSKDFWEKVMTDFNEKTTTKWPRSMAQAKFRKLEQAWKKITEGRGPKKSWLFEREMELLNAVRNQKSGAESQANEGSQQGAIRWSTAETLRLILTYKKYLPMFYQKGTSKKVIWRSILSKLDGRIRAEFSEDSIRCRIEDIKKYYKELIENKAEGVRKTWPLFQAVRSILHEEERLEAENEPSSYLSGGEDDGEGDLTEEDASSDPEYKPSDTDMDEPERNPYENEMLRWTGQETKQLLTAYANHVWDLVMTPANKQKRKVWERIAAEVQMSGSRQCNPYLARMKMVNLKRTYEKQKKGLGRAQWPFSEPMAKVMQMEADAYRQLQGSDMGDANPPSPPSLEEPPRKKSKLDVVEGEPAWFARYRIDAKRRHDEKMKLKLKLLNVLQTFVDQT